MRNLTKEEIFSTIIEVFPFRFTNEIFEISNIEKKNKIFQYLSYITISLTHKYFWYSNTYFLGSQNLLLKLRIVY
jgi:hypothetical protein